MTAKKSSHRPAAVPKSAERLGKLLVEAGLITAGRIADALRYQEIRKIKLGQALIELGFASYRRIAYALSIQLNIPYITLRTIRIKKDALSLIPREIVMDFQLIPLKKVNGALFIVVAEPPVADLVKALSEITKMPVHLAIAPQDEVAEAIKKYYPAESLRNIPITGAAAAPPKRSVGGTLMKSRPSSPDNRRITLPDKKHHKTSASGGRSDQLIVKSVKRRAGAKPAGGEKHGQKGRGWRWSGRATVEAHPFESRIRGTDRGTERADIAVQADHQAVAGTSGGASFQTDDTTGIFNISKPADPGNHLKGNRFFGGGDKVSVSARDDHLRFDTESPSIGSTDTSARMGVPLKKQKSTEAVEYFEMGLSALNEGSGREALRHFEAALAMDPDNRLYRANIERLKKKNSEA